MNQIYNSIENMGLIPVIKLDSADDALPLADALIAGGLPSMEITFRTQCAAEAVGIIAKNRPEILLGAGTVLTVDQAKLAADSGAKFIISPGINPKVVSWCIENNIPVLPGCATPTDILFAMSFGLDTVKFFPAESYGGIKTLKAIAAAFTDIKFMPTGGITLENMGEYLAFSKVIACGGSFMATDKLLKAKAYGEIAELCKQAAENVKNARKER